MSFDTGIEIFQVLRITVANHHLAEPRLQHADVFRLIAQHNLFKSVHDKILALFELDAGQASSLFLEHSDQIAADLIVSRLQSKPALLFKVCWGKTWIRPYFFKSTFFLCSTWTRCTRKTPRKDRANSTDCWSACTPNSPKRNCCRSCAAATTTRSRRPWPPASGWVSFPR